MSLRKDALGWPCNCNSSCAPQQVPTRPLPLVSGVHGLHEQELHYVTADITLGNGRPWLAHQIAPVRTRFPKEWPMDISLEDILCYLHDAKAASLLDDKTSVSGEVDCGKTMRGCDASFPMLLLMVDEKTSIYNSIINMALSTKDASTHDRSERSEALLFGCRSLPSLPNAAKDPKATSFVTDNTLATGKVYYEDLSTKYSSIYYPSERVAQLCKIQLSHKYVVRSWGERNLGWRSLSRLLKVEGLLFNNVLSESRLHAELTGAVLINGERQTHRRAATSSNEETRGPGTEMTRLQTNALHFSSAVAGTFMVENEDASHLQVEGPHCNNVLSGSGPHAQLTGAALVHGGCQTHHHAVTTTSDEAVGLQQMKQQSGRRLICPGPGEQEDANVLEVEGPLCAGDGGCQTHHHAAVGDATESDSVLVSIFVRHAHVSGGLVLTVNLDEPSQQMMCLYAQKTNTKLGLQYFIYDNKRLEPDSTLLSSGVKADSTVHVCTRLRGVVTISNFLIENKAKLLKEVTLPDGKVSLEMTQFGCLFLSTWLKCFTQAFANSKSWNGKFTRDHFKVVFGGHVLVNSGAGCDAKVRLDSSSMKADMARLVQDITAIFKRNESNLVSKFPPYMENLITFLGSMGSPALYDVDRLFIETHVCCVESAARGVLLAMMQRKYKSLSTTPQLEWRTATECIDENKSYAIVDNLSTAAVFQDIITEAKRRGQAYGSSKYSIFRLMRDEFVHGPSHRFDKSSDPWQEKFKNDDGIELMIPAHNKDCLPEIIYSMIKGKKTDIKGERLEAQVRCTCHICHPPPQGSKGKGKQPEGESSGSSQPSTPAPSVWQQRQAGASSGSSQPAAPGPRQEPPSVRQQPQAAAGSGSSQSAARSSRQGPAVWQQHQAGARPGQAQGPPESQQHHAGARQGQAQQSPQAEPGPRRLHPAPTQQSLPLGHRPPSAAPTQQQSSSSESGWQTINRKGKGKRDD